MIDLSLFIDLNNIEYNINRIKLLTNKDIMAVIKNNAYGIGTNVLLPLLSKINVNWIVYNKYSEYIKDININQSFNILILESFKKTFKCRNNNLYYSINSYEDAILIKDIKEKINIHIQVDVGMNREGIKIVEEFKDIIEILGKNKYINIDGLYTHFSSGLYDDELYYKELNRFKEFKTIYKFKHIHSAATSSLGKEIEGNMVRVGLAIYGYGNIHLKLLPSISFKCNVIKQFTLYKNEYIGYGLYYKANDDMNIIVVDIGYSDIKEIDYLTSKDDKYYIIGKSCMNHMFLKADSKINNLTKLNVLSKNDIIGLIRYNWYHIMMSIRNISKNYIRRYNNDISKVFKRTNQKNQRFTIRRRGYQTIGTRTIRFRWS